MYTNHAKPYEGYGNRIKTENTVRPTVFQISERGESKRQREG